MKKSQKKILEDITEIDLLELADEYSSASHILRDKYGFSEKGQYTSIINKKMKQWDIKFLNPYTNGKKYTQIVKVCPVCKTEFNTLNGGTEERYTCSYACSNTHFRSGENNGNYTGANYRTKCFNFHKKECVVCGESRIVEVHHFDGNNKNNSKDNLIPLCSTHHRYWHSRYKNLVEDKVISYREDFISSQN